MLKLYRGMKADKDGQPECGSTARSLGVRVPGDIAPDVEGVVHTGTGGMSVAPDDPLLLRAHRRPRALLGTGPDPVFCIGVEELGESLAARQDKPDHALVEPAVSMALPFYVRALHVTRLSWRRIA